MTNEEVFSLDTPARIPCGGQKNPKLFKSLLMSRASRAPPSRRAAPPPLRPRPGPWRLYVEHAACDGPAGTAALDFIAGASLRRLGGRLGD